ncbi:hypothetical protein LDENG_00176570 [Lucifuga dentata]|nr:hypothetical protein LDENG_00176570 [Lucifuga dentata]
MDSEIKVPQTRKAKVMLWTDVSYHDMEEIDKMQSIADLERVLCSAFGIDLPEPKRGVLLELYLQILLFCRKNSFTKEQTSALLSITKSIHEVNTETPLDNMEQCFKYCKELLLCHSVRRPPFSIDLFSSDKVTYVLKFIHSSYLRHYKLYKYIFTPQVKLDLSLTYSGMPEDDRHTIEDSAVPIDVEVEGEAAEAVPEKNEFPDTSTTEPEGATLGSKSELKTLIQEEISEQIKLLSGQLEERMKEITDGINSTVNSRQPNPKAKK